MFTSNRRTVPDKHNLFYRKLANDDNVRKQRSAVAAESYPADSMTSSQQQVLWLTSRTSENLHRRHRQLAASTLEGRRNDGDNVARDNVSAHA